MITHPSRDADPAAWIALRERKLGASEVGAVLGISPHDDAQTLAQRKLGKLAFRETARTIAGQHLERYALDMYAATTGRAVAPNSTSYEDPDTCPDLIVTPDGYTVDETGEVRLIEVKTSSAAHATDWQAWTLDPERTPNGLAHYAAQVQAQLAVTRTDRADLVAVCDGLLYIVPITRNPDWIEYARPIITAWIKAVLVEHRIPEPAEIPTPTKAPPVERPDLADVLAEWADANDAVKAAETRVKACRDRFDDARGADLAVTHAGVTVTMVTRRAPGGIDTDALKRDHPELVAAYTKPTTTTSYPRLTRKG